MNSILVNVVSAKGEVYPIKDCPVENPLVFDYESKQDVTQRAKTVIKITSRGIHIPIPKDKLFPKKSEEAVHYKGRMSGGRAITINESNNILRLKGTVYTPRMSEVFQEFDKELILPPLAIPYIEQNRGNRQLERIEYIDKDGTRTDMFLSQPRGILFETAVREGLIYNFALSSDIPVGEECLGICKYNSVQYEERSLGHEFNLLTGEEMRVDDLVCNSPNKLGFPELARRTLENFRDLQGKLHNRSFFDILFEDILQSSGKILSQMHSNGIIHGPRQSHFGNYSIPDSKGLKVCDLENSLLATELTNKQYIEYAVDDIILLLNSLDKLIGGLNSAFSVFQTVKLDTNIPEGLEEIFENPPIPDQTILEGYLNGKVPFKIGEKCDIDDIRNEIIKKFNLEKIKREQQKAVGEFFECIDIFDAFPKNILSNGMLRYHRKPSEYALNIIS